MSRRASSVALFAAAIFLSQVTAANAACLNFLGGYTASKHWLASAEKGDPLAQANAGDMYRRGDGVEKDFDKARAWIQKSVEQGCEQGEYGLAQLYFYGQGVEFDLSKAAQWARKAAEKGLPEAQHQLASHLETGVGEQKNEEEAFLWYQKAADQSYAYAQWALGKMFIDGRGTDKNLIDGYYWWSIATMPDVEHAKSEREKVRQHMTDSQVRIAESRIQAWREKHEFEAVKARAESDWPAPSPDAQLALAWKYHDGKGTQKDAKLAFKWFLKAAEHGLTVAQYASGICYRDGDGVEKDSRRAFEWLQKSAEQGYANAQGALGDLYGNGDGIPKDEQLAVAWHQKAAKQGNAITQNNLGVAYEYGNGVSKDVQSAYFWYLLSAAGGVEIAIKNRDRIERALTPDERAKAQAAARDWKPSSASSNLSPSDASTPSNAKPKATGSGFFVSRSSVVTNFHVIDGCARVAVSGKGAARVQSSDARNDLALLEVKAGNDSTATLRDGKLRAGEPITVIGYPLAGLLAQGANVTTGNVSALAGPLNDVRLIQITAPVQSGNSGGPLIDASGNVAGVVVSKLDTLKVAKATGEITQNVNFAINGTMLQAFLDSAGIQYKTAPLGRKLSSADIAERAKQFTALVECY